MRLLVIENDVTDPVGRLGEWFEGAGATLEVVRAYRGEPVPTRVPDGIDGVVPMGGAMDCDDDDRHPFLVEERALLVDAVGRDAAVFAVCLGAQLLAHALGGAVRRAPTGEIGLSWIELNGLAPTDRLARLLPARTPVAQYHRDEVGELPPGAVLLASNAACRHQLWRVGESAWAVQGHPEVDGPTMTDWVQDEPADLERVGVDAARAAADVASADEAATATWRPVAEAFVEVAAAR